MGHEDCATVFTDGTHNTAAEPVKNVRRVSLFIFLPVDARQPSGREARARIRNSVELPACLGGAAIPQYNSIQAMPEGQANIPRVGIFLLWIKSATVRSAP